MAETTLRFRADERDAVRGTDRVAAGLERVERQAKQTGTNASASMNTFERSLGRVAGRAAIGLGAIGAAATGMAAVMGLSFYKTRQSAEIAFTTMLGSGQKARRFLDELAAFAAKTPFEFPDLIRTSQNLLNVGFASKDVIPLLTRVGAAVSAAGGSPDVLQRTVVALGQIQSAGRVTAEDMNQLTDAGTFGWRALAEQLDLTVAKTRDLASKGLIPADVAIEAFVRNADQRFGGLTEKQSHSWAGLSSTIKDTLSQTSATVLTPFFELVTRGMQRVVDDTGSPEFTAGVRHLADVVETDVVPRIEDFVHAVIDHRGEIADAFREGADMAQGFATAVGEVHSAISPVVDALGGWDTVMEGLLAASVVSKLAKLQAAFTTLAGAEAAQAGAGAAAGATGIGGAAKQSGTLLRNLRAIGKIGAITVGLDLLINWGYANKVGASTTGTFQETKDFLRGLASGDFSQVDWSMLLTGDQGVIGSRFADKPAGGGGGAGAGALAGVTAGTPAFKRQQKAILGYARQFGPGSGILYHWGGASPQTGFDCSGYLQQAYKAAGIDIPHNTVEQFNDPNAIDTTGRELPGDGVYFETRGPGGAPQHCGIYIGSGEFIEYFTEGKPAKTNTIEAKGGYMGARRWLKIRNATDAAAGAGGGGGGGGGGNKPPLRLKTGGGAAKTPQHVTLRDLSHAAAQRFGIDPALLDALIFEESGWNPGARSSAGAMGLTQLMPGTAAGLGVKDPYNPKQNVTGGAKYLAQLYRRAKAGEFGPGDPWVLALVAYNAGPAALKAGRAPRSSYAYARRVLRGAEQGVPGGGAATDIPGAPGLADPAEVAGERGTVNIILRGLEKLLPEARAKIRREARALSRDLDDVVTQEDLDKLDKRFKRLVDSYNVAVDVKRQHDLLARQLRALTKQLAGIPDEFDAEIEAKLPKIRAALAKIASPADARRVAAQISKALGEADKAAQDALTQAEKNFDRAWGRLRDRILKAFDELAPGGRLRRATEFAEGALGTAQAERRGERALGVIQAIEGAGPLDPELERIRATANEVQDARRQYNEALLSGDEEAQRKAADRLAKAQDEYAQIEKDGLSDRAKAYYDAYGDIIAVEEKRGQERLDAEQKRLDELDAVNREDLENFIDDEIEKVHNQEETWGEAWERMKKKAAEFGIDLDAVGGQLGADFNSALISAIQAVAKAVEDLAVALKAAGDEADVTASKVAKVGDPYGARPPAWKPPIEAEGVEVPGESSPVRMAGDSVNYSATITLQTPTGDPVAEIAADARGVYIREIRANGGDVIRYFGGKT